MRATLAAVTVATPVAAMVAAVSPLAAQSTASGRATIQIGEIMGLRVSPAENTRSLATDGEYREVTAAVRLEVVSNRPWQLSVVAAGPDGRVVGPDAAGEPERRVWWRVAASDAGGAVEPYQRAERWPVVVARGGPGRIVVDVDYRWLDGGWDAAGLDALHFTLAPN